MIYFDTVNQHFSVHLWQMTCTLTYTHCIFNIWELNYSTKMLNIMHHLKSQISQLIKVPQRLSTVPFSCKISKHTLFMPHFDTTFSKSWIKGSEVVYQSSLIPLTSTDLGLILVLCMWVMKIMTVKTAYEVFQKVLLKCLLKHCRKLRATPSVVWKINNKTSLIFITHEY